MGADGDPGDGLFHSLQDVERVVLKVADGTPVLVRDVADVAFGGETRQGAMTRDGQGETMAGMVIMLRGANSRTVVEAVKAQVGASSACCRPASGWTLSPTARTSSGPASAP